MKNILRYFSLSALAALMILSACSDPFDTISGTEKPAAGSGNVSIIIGNESNARTLFPTADQFTGYRIDCTNGVDTVTKTVESTVTKVDMKLTPGSWTITVTGLVGTDKIEAVYGSDNVNIELGKTATVKIVLNDNVSETAGIFHYSLRFPNLDSKGLHGSYTAATLTITPQNPNFGTVSFNLKEWVNKDSSPYSFTGDLELPPGYYTMDIALVSTRYINEGYSSYAASVYRKEAVHIYSNMKTSTPDYVFEDKDFTADLYFQGKINLTNNVNGKTYKPDRVELSLNTDRWEPNIRLNDSFIIDQSNYWELSIHAKDINDNHNVNIYNNLYFRAVYKDEGSNSEVYGRWSPAVSISNIHGTPSDIVLSDTISTVNSNPRNSQSPFSVPTGFTVKTNDYKGGENTDFAYDTTVQFYITTPEKYGVIRDSVEYSYNWNYYSYNYSYTSTYRNYGYSPNGDFALYYFDMPNYSDVTISQFKWFRLDGTVAITGNVRNYRPYYITVEYYDDGYYQNIGNNSVSGGVWNIGFQSFRIRFELSETTDMRFTVLLTSMSVPSDVQNFTIYINTTPSDLYANNSALTIPDPAAALPAPTGVTVEAGQNISVVINWDNVSDAQGYNVYRNDSNTPLNSSLITTNSYVDSTVSMNSSYSYRVSTRNRFGVDGEKSSSTVSFTVTTIGLSNGTWYDNTLPAGGEHLYRFYADNYYTYYYIEGNDSDTGGDKTCNIQVSVYREDDISNVLVSGDVGSQNKSFYNYNRGYIIIKVSGKSSSDSGTYSIKYYSSYY